jgi:DNA-binding transcriptional LysR family regulator
MRSWASSAVDGHRVGQIRRRHQEGVVVDHHLDRVVGGLETVLDAVAGRLTVGMMEVPSESLDVATLMATFHSRYPDVTVTLRSGGSDVLVEATRDRKLDAAIVGPNVARAADQLTFTHLFSESLIAVMPIDHPLTQGSSVSVTELAVLPFIDFPPGYGLRHETDRGFAGVARRVAFEVTRISCARPCRHRFDTGIAPGRRGRYAPTGSPRDTAPTPALSGMPGLHPLRRRPRWAAL